MSIQITIPTISLTGINWPQVKVAAAAAGADTLNALAVVAALGQSPLVALIPPPYGVAVAGGSAILAYLLKTYSAHQSITLAGVAASIPSTLPAAVAMAIGGTTGQEAGKILTVVSTAAPVAGSVPAVVPDSGK